MTETQRRIRAYKRALPELRERVIAVALLLAMSASMLGSASFAWITLSTAPEATGMATTVAANGNLEIALAQGASMSQTGVPMPATEPDESAVGDSSVKQGIVNSNTTWGNLVNLSEPEYGVSNIALRPALLNNTNRNKYPLYGAKYGGDGRVVDTTNRYEYTSWQDIGEGVWSFAAGEKTMYGVRAISSVGYDTEVGNKILDDFSVATQNAYGNTAGTYQRMISQTVEDPYILTSGRTCLEALEGLVAVFAQDRINNMADGAFAPNGMQGQNTSCSKYIYDFYEMLGHMRDILLLEGEGLRQMANWQAYSNTPEGQNPNTNTFTTVEELIGSLDEKPAETQKKLQAKGVNLSTFTEFKQDYLIVLKCISDLLSNSKIVDAGGIDVFKNANDPNLPTVYYSDVASSVNELANINTTTINGIELQSVGGSNATQIINGGPVVIKHGVLKRFEQRAISDDTLRVQADVVVKVKMTMVWEQDKEVPGHVTTSADGDGTYLTDYGNCGTGGVAGQGEAVAKDTYGMAIDLWVRTNYSEAVLTLEGSVQTQQVHAQDASGNYLYTIAVDEMEVEVYRKTLDETDTTYYYSSNGEEVSAEDLGTPQIVYEDVIIGYEGVNRIWSEEALATMAEKGYLAKDPTTQGSGSCFVFYADSRPEQEKLLEMLESFTVVFLDASGNRLATAKLNTPNAFRNQGKVTVPLEVISGVTYEEEQNSGDAVSKTGIMTLAQNQATRVTAIVYLDGTNLKNENVLSAGEMNGQLNIQFGTNSLLLPPANEELQQEYRTITASAQSDDGQTWPTSAAGQAVKEISYDTYSADGHDITVNLAVDGVAPDKISGFFVRVISSSQGTRMETVEFEPTDEEKLNWTATFRIKDPGTYILSDLLVDGMQYALAEDNHPTVTIPGLSLGTVTTWPSNTYMTAESNMAVPVTATILSDMGTPSRVTAHFYEKGNASNQISAPLSYTGNNGWTGDANFGKSGTYILDSITVDGQSLDVPNKTELTFRLGMQCEVYSAEENANTRFPMEGSGVQVKVTANIWDDSRTPMEGMENVVLIYSYNNSALNTTQCEMTWSSAGYYTGTLNLTRVGRYNFNSMAIGSTGAIGSANIAPELVVTSDKPLGLVTDDNGNSAYVDEWQYAFADASVESARHAALYVKITDPNATVWAQLTDTDGNQDLVQGSYDDVTESFLFKLTEGGTWTLNNIYCQDVMVNGWNYKVTDESGVLASDKSAYKLTPNSVTVKVVDDLTVTGTITAGGTTYTNLNQAVALSGSFLEEHPVALNLTVTDQDGVNLNYGLVNATWKVTYVPSTAYDNGKYTITNVQTLSEQTGTTSDGKTIAVTDSVTYAGSYSSQIIVSLDLDNDGVADYQYAEQTLKPSLLVKSSQPTAKVTGVSAEHTDIRMYTTATPSSTDNMIRGTFSTFNQYTPTTAAVYMYVVGDPGMRDQEAAHPLKPSVSLEISGVPITNEVSDVSMLFEHNTEGKFDSKFAFTASGTVYKATQAVGDFTDGEDNDWYPTVYPQLYPAGKMTQNQIAVTHNSATIVADLTETITINNPLYPPYVDFASTSTNGITLPTTPSRIYATPNADGDLQVTLPTLSSWTEEKSSITGNAEDYVVQPGYPQTRQVYRTWTRGCDTFYEGYTETVTVSKASTTTTTWTNTYNLQNWKIGNALYKPGEAIDLTGANTATAVIETIEGTKTSKATTTTKTVTTYTNATGQMDKNPGGEDIGTGSNAPQDSTVLS